MPRPRRSSPTGDILGHLEVDQTTTVWPEKLVVQDRDQAEKARQQLKGEAEDDDRDGPDTLKDKEVADHLERLLKDLGERLSKDLGPVGEEFLKALDKAVEGGDRSRSTRRESPPRISAKALEKARDKMHEAFKEGGPLNKQGAGRRGEGTRGRERRGGEGA